MRTATQSQDFILFSSVLYSENEGIYYTGHKESTACNGHDAIA